MESGSSNNEEEVMSKEQEEGYQVVPFPIMRRFAADSGRLSRRRNYMIGLLEFDVTDARRAIQAHKAATGEALSFTYPTMRQNSG